MTADDIPASLSQNGGANPVRINPSAVFTVLGSKVTNGIGQMFAKLGNLSKWAKFVHGSVLGTQQFIYSLIILIICCAIIVLVYVLIRIIRLRGFGIWHSENLEEFMSAFHSDIDTTRKLFRALEASKQYFDTTSGNLLDMMNCKQTIAYFEANKEETLEKNFDTYFKYYDIMHSSLDQWFHSNELEKFARDGMTGETYLNNLIKSIQRIRAEIKQSVNDNRYLPTVQRVVFLCSSLTKEEYEKVNLPNLPSKPLAESFITACHNKQINYETFMNNIQQFIDLCIGIQIMHLYFSVYFNDIKELHNSRRFSFFNFLIVLMKPYVRQLIFEKIVDPWKELMSPKGRFKDWKKFIKAWKTIGDAIKSLPKKLVKNDDNKDEKFENDREPEDADIIEGFGFLKGLLSVGDFFASILGVAFALAKLISRPFDALMFVIKMVVGITVALFLLIIYLLLSLPPFIYVIYAIYFFIFNIVLFIVFSMWYALLFAYFGLLSLILWVLDLMLSSFNGFTAPSIIAKMGRCENMPDVWHTRGGFIDHNNFNRAFFCQRPCASRFKPNGIFCSRLDMQQPSFCPQAQAFRIYKGMKLSPNPFSMGDFTPDPTFWTKSKEARREDIKNYFVKRQEFLTKCSSTNQPYDFLIKTICSNYDTVTLPNENDRPKLQTVCKQIYCEGRPNEDFCYKFADKKDKPNDQDEEADRDVVARIMKLLIMIILAVIVALMFLYNS
jgi:hypothetical protein